MGTSTTGRKLEGPGSVTRQRATRPTIQKGEREKKNIAMKTRRRIEEQRDRARRVTNKREKKEKIGETRDKRRENRTDAAKYAQRSNACL